MKWNSNAPLELLSQMPKRLTNENLEKIQAVIDNDKMICGIMMGKEVCGEYAPFCDLCNRSLDTPCAVAYIKMLQAEGYDYELPLSENEFVFEEEEFVDEEPVEVTETVEVYEEPYEEYYKEEVEEDDLPKMRVRIATLKRKINR